MVKNKHNFSPVIPGMSLTTEPKSRPWESPPKMVRVSEAVDFYSEKLTDPEVIGSVLEMVKKGIPIDTISTGITKIGLMNGLHSVDTGVMVSPVVTELIKAMAELNEVDYITTREELDTKNVLDESVASSAMEAIKNSSLQEELMEEEPEEKTGLMARGKKDE